MCQVLKVGLTGGIGSGKSTVCKLFADLGVPVIDADEIGYQVVKPGRPGLRMITKVFGDEVLTESGELDRSRLRIQVFNNDAARKALENILHPLIFQEIDAKVGSLKHHYCIICIPLLVETHSINKVDRVLVIDLTEEQQILRASLRDQTGSEEITKIMRTQASRTDRLAVADDIIHNDDDLTSLSNQVYLWHEYYNKMSAR
jgi:dephospho-CoA kinase